MWTFEETSPELEDDRTSRAITAHDIASHVRCHIGFASSVRLHNGTLSMAATACAAMLTGSRADHVIVELQPADTDRDIYRITYPDLPEGISLAIQCLAGDDEDHWSILPLTRTRALSLMCALANQLNNDRAALTL